MSEINREPIDIVRVIRPMRGGSQAHLVEGQDGLFYVAKFSGNPQGTRTLVNEWFAHQLFHQMGISVPSLRVLRLTPAMQKRTEHLIFRQGKKQTAVEPGLHLGSQCPVNPETTAIFDFLPRKMLPRVANPEDFAKTLVLDLFLGQADARQAIFIREAGGNAVWRMRAYMIDHGWALGGSLWQLRDSLRPWYFDRIIYSLLNLQAECEQALHQVLSLTDEDLYRFSETIPCIWLSQSDQADWARVLRHLSARKCQLAGQLDQCLHALRGDQEKAPSKVGCEEREHWAGLSEREQCVIAKRIAFLPRG